MIVERAVMWRYFPLLGLSGVWGIMVLLAYPVGEFPLNDTWAFSGPVQTWLDTGSLTLSHWPYMTLIAHLIWGYLVTLVFGFSYTILRCSVAFLGLAGLWALYELLMEVTRDRRTAWLGTAVLAVNPLYFHLACTFMTDVPFLAFSLMSILLLVKGMRRESLLLIAGGILLACWAILIRQVGLVIPAAFAVAYGFKHRLRWPAWVLGILVVGAAFGVLAGYEHWLELTGKTPLSYRQSESDLLFRLSAPGAWLTFADTTVACFIYLGLFLLPLLISRLPGRAEWADRPSARLLQAGILIGWTLAVAGMLLHQGRLMPLRMNGSIFYDWGLGPPTLRDVFILDRAHLPRAAEWVMFLLTALGAMGGGLLLLGLWRAAWAVGAAWIGKRQAALPAWTGVMALAAFGMYLVPMLILIPFDRYLLFGVPLATLWLLSLPRTARLPRAGFRRVLAAGCLVLFAAFGVVGTHDYLSWNRARWQAAHDLMGRLNIPATKIDGGFEFNALYGYDWFYTDDGSKSWWWVEDDQYHLAFGPIRHYTEYARYRYRRWFPWGHGWIHVLRRNDGSDTDIIITATRKHGGDDLLLHHADIVRYWHGNGHSAPVALSYGDFVELEPGRYTATLYYRAQKPRRDHGHGWGQIRLVKFDNGPAIREEAIAPVEPTAHGYQTQSVEFSLTERCPVEVQLIGGDARLWLYRLVFKKAE